MRKHMQRMTVLILVVAMVFTMTAGVSAATYTSGDYVGEKFSHPDNPVKTVDGIVDYVGNGVVAASDQGQGDRGQNYSWAAIGYGDYMYVSTCYNAMGNTLTLMDSVLGNDFEPETMTAMLNVLYNGHFYTGEPDGGNPGGVLVKVNVNTGEVTLLMSRATTGESCLFRNVCEYQGKLYFCGSVNGLPSIYQLDPTTDETKMVYQGMTLEDYYAGYVAGICTGIRGLCEFNGQLIVSCVNKEGPVILSSTHPWDGQEAFTQIADQEDLFGYPAYHYDDSIYGGSIWEMVDFNGSLYVSICTGTEENMPDENTMQSFALVRGDQAEDGSWQWTSVIGDQQKDGAKYTFGIDPERTRAGAGVLMVYGDYLYIGEYNDEQIALENVLFSIDFDFVNANLSQSVSLYRMDKNEDIQLVMGDATEMFPEGSLSGLESGFGRRENQYIWRMNVYDGKLYVGTFDTSSLLEPVGQFSNGDLANMTPEEWEQLLEFIRILLELHNGSEDEGDTGSNGDARIQRVAQLMEDNTDAQLAVQLAGSDVTIMAADSGTDPAIADLLDMIQGIITCAAALKDSVRGFDCYVTEDGVNFETITVDGLADPYNHGLRVYANTDAGMCIGTANPFYGTQLWTLGEDITAKNSITTNLDIDFDNNVTAYAATAPVDTREFTFTVTPADPAATILVNGEVLKGYHGSVALKQGVMNTVVISIVNTDGTQADYTFAIFPLLCDNGENCPSARFNDVDPTRWYHLGIDFCVANGIMIGTHETVFGTNDPTSRAQLVTMLWRMSGSPEPEGMSPFEDVPADRYYTKAVAWAWENNVIAGTSETTFAPNANVSRQDFAVILYHFTHEVLGLDVSAAADLSAYPDAENISGYAKDAMAWAVAEKLISGVYWDTQIILQPKGRATRAQVASIIYRYYAEVLN